jgi:hypothetical protein
MQCYVFLLTPTQAEDPGIPAVKFGLSTAKFKPLIFSNLISAANTLLLYRRGTDRAENTALLLLRDADYKENTFTLLFRDAYV